MIPWKERYTAAYREHFRAKYPEAWRAGHCPGVVIPEYKKANGLRKLCCSYMKWTGHHLEPTNNMGRPIEKFAPKFNVFSGKVEKIPIGFDWQKGAGINGSSDCKGHFNSKNHKFPIPVYLEVKIGRDRQSDDQIKYEKIITDTGALYQVVKIPEDFFTFYDWLSEQ